MSADITIAPLNHSRTYVFADEGITKEIGEHFSFEVPSAKFMTAYKRRHWDGRIRLFHKPTSTLPTGLIPRLLRFAGKQGYSVHNKLADYRTDWSSFDTDALLAKYPVAHDIRDYQKDAITWALHHQRGVLLSPTASGKSLILYYLIRQRMSMGPVLLIVPSISLVSQMVSDFIAYGWTDADDYIHKITGGVDKHTTKPVVVSTWQSIHKLPESWFYRFTAVFGDEAHTFKAESLQSIMAAVPHCVFRIGCTGTLDDAKANSLTVESAFGPAHRVARTADLQTQGHLTPIKIQGHFLQYGKHDKWMLKEHHRKYTEEMDYLVQHPSRMRWLVDFCSQLSGNVLILYQYVEKHGVPLYHALREKFGINRPVYFVSGDVDGDQRERVRALLEASEHTILSFGAVEIRCTPDERIPLTDGFTKAAHEITVEDDVDDRWITANSSGSGIPK